MLVLLSIESFDAFGGTETYTLTVAGELARLGHHACIFSPRLGTMAEVARGRGARVVGRDQLPRDCDVVIAQDATTAYELADRYPQATRLMVAHSRDHVLQEPPQLPGACDGIVVMNDRVGRWARARAWHPPLTRLRQPIDLSRYRDLSPPRPRPRRVLVTSNYVAGPRGRLLDEACRRAGYEVDWIGSTTKPSASPEDSIAAADIVVGLGRSALEAMAAGRAVYVYGALGGAGWVTDRSYPELEADGFAGLTDPRPATIERLAEELRCWQPDMGECNRDLASANHSIRTHAVELIELVHELAPRREGDQHGSALGRESGAPRTPPLVSDELARLLRLEWKMYEQRMVAVLEADYLRRERDAHRARADDAAARVSTLDEQLASANARVATLDEHLADARSRVIELEPAARQLQRRAHRLTRGALSLLDGLRSHARPG